jgi:hypothetical protein
LYERVEDVPEIIETIERMDPRERQATIDRAVGFIQWSNRWHETASLLLTGG